MRKILHSDCNSFYASVECLYRPEIRDKPVAVGGDPENRHGIILTKNNIAKKYGIKTGQAVWQAKQLCPELVVLPPDFSLYMRFSKLTREIYLDYTNRVEPFGLDEAWLDVTGNTDLNDNGMSIAKEISRRVKRELGITVSIGVSFNKVFAKLGSDYKKPDAITQITKENYKNIAWSLPASDMLYVGKANKQKLSALGIYTIGQLANAPIPLLKSHFGKWGELLHSFANGYDVSPVKEYEETTDVKSIGNSTTAPRDLCTPLDVKIVLNVLADSVGRRMRAAGLTGKTITVSVRDNTLHSFTRQRKLDFYTNITAEISTFAEELFRQSYNWDKPIRSLGVAMSDLAGEDVPYQMDIFQDTNKKEQLKQLDKTIDSLKSRFGTSAVCPASLLIDKGLSGFDPINDHTIHPVGYF